MLALLQGKAFENELFLKNFCIILDPGPITVPNWSLFCIRAFNFKLFSRFFVKSVLGVPVRTLARTKKLFTPGSHYLNPAQSAHKSHLDIEGSKRRYSLAEIAHFLNQKLCVYSCQIPAVRRRFKH